MGEVPGAQAAEHAVCAVATRPRATLNQDAVACGAAQDIAVVAVADGISETGPRSAIVAQAAATHMVNRVLAQTDTAEGAAVFADDHWFDVLFHALPHVCEDALDAAGERWNPDGEGLSPKTTLIAAIRLPEELIVAYVGDGVAKVTTGRLIMARNLLIPHWNDNGHLTRYVSPEAPAQPTVIRLRTNFDEGELVLIGSDGAFPNRASDPTVFIIDTLKHQVTADQVRPSPAAIGAGMLGILEQALGGRLLDDDASLGVILSRRAVDYWRQSANAPVVPATEAADVVGEVPDADG